MEHFLNSLKKKLDDLSKQSTVYVVMGNESCDLDSAISPIVYACFLDWMNTNKYVCSENNSNNSLDLFLPLLNISKEDLPLKTEVLHFLKKVHIDPELLLFRDDIDIKTMHEKCNFHLILIDHHMLGEVFSDVIPFVSVILDHRPKDLNWPYNDKTTKSNIQIVGSCATIVCSEIVATGEGQQFLTDCKTAAELLYGTIVLDTVNFLPSADRARPLDFEMAAILELSLQIQNIDSYRLQIFNELLTSRVDSSSLTTLQLLRRDLKVVADFPIPGLPMLVKEYLERDDCESSLQYFCKKYNFTTILLMGLIIKDDIVHRDIAVYSPDDCDQHTKVIKALCESKNPSLQLVNMSCSINNCDYYIQINTKASRKQIIPIIKSIM